MGSKTIHYLSEDARQHNDSPQSRGLKHLAAAHEKLLKLQAARKKLKIQYADRADELEIATREIEKNRVVISNQSELLKEYESIIEAQSGLIDELRAETTRQEIRLERRRASAMQERDALSITARVVEKHEKASNLLKEKSSKTSLPGKIFQLLK